MIKYLKKLQWRWLTPEDVKRRLALYAYILSKHISKEEMEGLENIIRDDDWWLAIRQGTIGQKDIRILERF